MEPHLEVILSKERQDNVISQAALDEGDVISQLGGLTFQFRCYSDPRRKWLPACRALLRPIPLRISISRHRSQWQPSKLCRPVQVRPTLRATAGKRDSPYLLNTIIFCSLISRIVQGMPPMP
jgi:hypothetical protein